MNIVTWKPPAPISPYNQGYLAANAAGTKQMDGGIVRLPRQIYEDGNFAHVAYCHGVADSIADRAPRTLTSNIRTSRAYPPWRII